MSERRVELIMAWGTGILIGAVVWWVVLMAGFGWLSPSEAKQASDTAAHDAVVSYATQACVNRFDHQAEAAQALKQLEGTDSSKQTDFIINGGWVAPVAQKSDSSVQYAVASGCASQLVTQKSGGDTKLGSS